VHKTLEDRIQYKYLRSPLEVWIKVLLYRNELLLLKRNCSSSDLRQEKHIFMLLQQAVGRPTVQIEILMDGHREHMITILL
jgi:hypothetical protein